MNKYLQQKMQKIIELTSSNDGSFLLMPNVQRIRDQKK